MFSDILKIKTVLPPLGATILSRPRIQECLNQTLTSNYGFTRPLTMFSAPAGFGKTTLAREWLVGRERQSAWLSLDEGDNDYERFWIYLITALQRVDSSLGNGSMEMLRSRATLPDASQGGKALLTPLLNQLFGLSTPIFLVLDDYHLVDNSMIQQDMVFFIENLPPSFHLVITTRTDPPWPLSRWRARGKMAEVRLDELKFSDEEAAQLFSKFKGIQLNEPQLNALIRKTEGWITGLQLAAFSLSVSHSIDDFIDSFAGSHRHVSHFLSEEVFSSQPVSVQGFLLQTSILNRLSAPICDAVTGRKDSSEILTSLESENLFLIPLDEFGTWYRYHPLFADLLLHKLKSKDPRLTGELRDRAARWFLEAGEPAEAIGLLLANQDVDKAGRILHDYYHDILLREGPGLLYRSLDLFPSGMLKQYPRLVAHKALFMLMKKGKEEARNYIEMAEGLSYEKEEEQEEYKGILAVVRSCCDIFSHRFPQALKNAEQALKLLPRHSYFWRMNVAVYIGDANLFSGNPQGAYPFYLEAQESSQRLGNNLLILVAGFKVAVSLYYMGRLQKAEELTRELLQTAKAKGLAGLSRIGLLWALLGELLREKGELEEAGHCIDRGLMFSEPERPCLGWNYLFKAALSFSQQDYEGVLETIHKIEALNLEVRLPLFITYPATIWQARTYLEKREPARAGDLLSQSGISRGCKIPGGQEKGYLVLARIMLEREQGAYDDTRKLLDQLSKMASRGAYRMLALEALLVKAALEEKRDNPEGAVSHLKAALHGGKEGGYFQVFLDEGRGLKDVYRRAIEGMADNASGKDRELLDFARKIYQALWLDGEGKEGEKKGREPGAALWNGLVEELSPRELEILELISQGLSNQEISEKLFLTLGTVKWHTSNIYGKLGIRGRTQALAKARKLKIIP